MRFIRFDSVGGASGDMLLGALAAIGADLNAIERVVRKCLPEKIHFHCEPAADGGLHGLRVNVHGAHDRWGTIAGAIAGVTWGSLGSRRNIYILPKPFIRWGHV